MRTPGISPPVAPGRDSFASVAFHSDTRVQESQPDGPVASLVGTKQARPALRTLNGGADNLLSVRQVAARLGVSTATVYALAERGEIPHLRVSNAIRIAPGDLARFIAVKRRVGPTGGRGSHQ